MSFTLIADPCVIESRDLALEVAERVKAITDPLGIRYIFKASYDKSNRSSGRYFLPRPRRGGRSGGAGRGEANAESAGAHRHP